jgi:hypothetical protein
MKLCIVKNCNNLILVSLYLQKISQFKNKKGSVIYIIEAMNSDITLCKLGKSGDISKSQLKEKTIK